MALKEVEDIEARLKKYVGKLVTYAVLGILLLIIVFGTFYTIPAGYGGVLMTFGKVEPTPIPAGIHAKIPLIQSVVKMEVRTQKYEADASASSSDLQIVTAKIATNYHLTAQSVPQLYNDIGLGYTERVIQPIESECVKSITAKFTAEELITKREEVRQEIKTLMTDRLQQRGIIVEEISIVNFDFSSEFNDAIEKKVVSQQILLKNQIDLQTIKVQAEQAQATAQGQAQAIQLINDQLKANPNYIEWLKVQKWDGHLPYVVGSATPFLNIDNLVGNAGGNVSATP